jgi:hypothetical protein
LAATERLLLWKTVLSSKVPLEHLTQRLIDMLSQVSLQAVAEAESSSWLHSWPCPATFTAGHVYLDPCPRLSLQVRIDVRHGVKLEKKILNAHIRCHVGGKKN